MPKRSSRGVRIHSVFLPKGNSVGFAQGIDVHTGEEIRFIGDWRPLYIIALDVNEITRTHGSPDDLPIAEVEPHQVVKISTGIMGSLDTEVRPEYELAPTPLDARYATGSPPPEPG